jgi:integrase/recombinase XerC
VRERWAAGSPWLFPGMTGNDDGSKPYSHRTFSQQLEHWQRVIDLRDQAGQPVTVTAHQFRHTPGTRLKIGGVASDASFLELQDFFDAADDLVERSACSRRKGQLAAFRDATLFKVVYGWGLRRREAAMLDVSDFTASPAAPELGSLGVCHVRYGKAMKGSPPRRRAVATVMPWAAEALRQYLQEVRPRYGRAGHPAVWLTERGGRISARQIDDRFAQLRALAGLPDDLSVHCLRHSYVSHLIEDGTDPLFVQWQAGHWWASTTATCTTVGQDARNRMLRAALARAYDGEDGR